MPISRGIIVPIGSLRVILCFFVGYVSLFECLNSMFSPTLASGYALVYVMLMTCSPALTFPHLANSDWMRQFLASLSIRIFTPFGSFSSISVRFPIGSPVLMYCVLCMCAVFASSSIVVFALIISVAANAVGSSSSSAIKTCFMLFHCANIVI